MAYVSLKFLLWFYKEGASKRKIAIVILNKVKNLKIYRYFATLRRVVEGLPEK